jgi:hypothetical protein
MVYLNSVEENFGFLAAVEVVTNRLKYIIVLGPRKCIYE